jgi:hypothetical protein
MVKKLIFIVIALLCFYSSAFARRVNQPRLPAVFDCSTPGLYKLLEYRVVGLHIETAEDLNREVSLPLFITDYHHGLFYWLKDQGLNDTVVVNLDAHRDYRNRVDGSVQITGEIHSGNWTEFGKEKGLISDLYWLIPSWVEVELSDQELAVPIHSLAEIDWSQYREKTVVLSIDLDAFSNRLFPRYRASLDQAVAYLGDMAQNLIDNNIRPIFHISESPNFTYPEDISVLREAVLNVFLSIYRNSH